MRQVDAEVRRASAKAAAQGRHDPDASSLAGSLSRADSHRRSPQSRSDHLKRCQTWINRILCGSVAAKGGQTVDPIDNMQRIPSIFSLLAGLMGAVGVVLAAVSTHVAPGPGLDSAAYILLFHAAALLGGTALTQQGILSRPPAFAALAGWVVGATVFSGDIALRTFAAHRLFPMAAPAGGTVLILGWLALAVAALPRFLNK
jgi:uncharacterized membrane protein YgdD (TMEM256/DUF423 family)